MKIISIFILFLFSCNSNKTQEMSTRNLKMNIIKWKSTRTYSRPADVLQVSDSEWMVLYLDNSYEFLSTSDNSLKTITAEGVYQFVGIEKKEDEYLMLLADKLTYNHTIWVNSKINKKGAKSLAIEDPEKFLYSKSMNKIYWTPSSKELFVYDFKKQSSLPLLEKKMIVDFEISSNGNFLAIENINRKIEVIDLNSNTVIRTHINPIKSDSLTESEYSPFLSLVGVSNIGDVFVLENNIIKKGMTSSVINSVFLLKENDVKKILEVNASWAKLRGEYLFVLAENLKGEEEYQLYKTSHLL